jgi:membrane-bound lytic murein transglycosylase D
MRFFAAALLMLGAAVSNAQAPEVPHKMKFAGMTLTVRDDARKEIQKDVDLLLQYPRYYAMKVERAKTYFPLIEKILNEEGVPEDFKFLVLQESALVPDAVSVSNAVGFWQFKDFTALEMGLRVDNVVDERMNIVSSTRGAARYLRQNNNSFDNWLLALQSYQMGAGGVKRAMGDSGHGARNMEVTTETYWYVKKFLAHMVAFGDAVSGEGQVRIIAYESTANRSLQDIARDVSADENILRDYNKWLKGKAIPSDKTYTVLIPVGKLDNDFNKLVLTSGKASRAMPVVIPKDIITQKLVSSINTVSVITAKPGERLADLAARGNVDLSSFLKYNEISIDHAVVAGDIFFLSKKKSEGELESYTVKGGDDVWSISQRFGVRTKSLRKYNHLTSDEVPAGSVIWLRRTRAKDEKPVDPEAIVMLDQEPFDWYIKSPVEPGPGDRLDEPKTGEIENPVMANVPVSLDNPHQVLAGETLYAIAKQYGVQVTELVAWNSLDMQKALKPGQFLKVADNETVRGSKEAETTHPASTTFHEVQPSDTLYSIARQYGVTINDIMSWNNKKDFSLSKGEKLVIKQR